MAKSFLIKPGEIEQRLCQRYKSNQKKWLAGDGEWPLALPLGMPTERQAQECLSEVKNWQKLWLEWGGEGHIQWVERRWSNLGMQRLPERILIHNPLQVVRWIGQEQIWNNATQRYTAFVSRWPCLAQVLLKYFKVLVDYDEVDFSRLFSVLDWLVKHPNSNLYIRQLPIEGVHTKWLFARKSMVAELLRAIFDCDKNINFYQLTGIRREPETIRFRLLDEELRNLMGGLTDITATVEDLDRMQLPLKKVYIVENLQTGLAFNDIPGALVFMSLGYAVDLYSRISWLKNIPIYYWGDIDTHGFAILNRLRSYFPHVHSLLMDERTLLTNKKLWGEEETPVIGSTLTLLTEDESRLYQDLCNHRWGTRLRLEQERISWEDAWKHIHFIDIN